MNEQLSFFFWLGEDGELSDLSGEEFEKKIEEKREAYFRWLNVVTGNDERE